MTTLKTPTLAQLRALAKRKGFTFFSTLGGLAAAVSDETVPNVVLYFSRPAQEDVGRRVFHAALSALPDKKASKR